MNNTWQPLEPHDVGVEDDADRLLHFIARTGPATYASRVRVLPQHPFFFEHPQDHLPGLYLLEVSRQLATASLGQIEQRPAAPAVTEFSVKFASFAEMHAKTDATATIAPVPGGLSIGFSGQQGDRTLCSATSRWKTSSPTGGETPPATLNLARLAFDLDRLPVCREMVHKRQDENVLLDWVARRDDKRILAGVRRVPQHRYFEPARTGRYGTMYLIEATRQFAEALSHAFLEVPLDHAFVIRSMGVVETWPARLDLPIHLVADRLEQSIRPESTRLHYAFHAEQGDRRIFTGDCSWLVVPPTIYKQMRRAA